jgi:hypothetical protein
MFSFTRMVYTLKFRMINNPDKLQQFLSVAKWAAVTALGLLFLFEVWLTLEWRMDQDSPLLYYVAFVIDKHGFVPYRDIFETSMPGTILFHLLLAKLFGYSDAAFRLVDIALLLLSMSFAWHVLRTINMLAACAAVLAFALIYLGSGPSMAMERDFVGFIPVLAAMWIATRQYQNNWTGGLFIGVLFGMAATIKPHLAIGLPVIFTYFVAEKNASKNDQGVPFLTLYYQLALVTGAAFLAVVAIPLLWLWAIGGLAAFWEMLTAYLPLHVDMTGNIETVTTEKKLKYILRRLSRDTRLWLPPALLGLGVGWFSGQLNLAQKRLLLMLAGMLLAYAAYPVFAAQFWIYHWLPFRIVVVLCAALMLLPLAKFRGSFVAEYLLAACFAVCVLVWSMFMRLQPPQLTLPWGLEAQMRGLPAPLPKDGRVDEIAEFLLEANLGPEDRVQPLDWTEGALHGMLIAEAVVATPYIYDYHFYHYVSNPYIKEIRQRFVTKLEEEPPRFLIDVDDQLKPRGLDTTDTFPELEAFVAAHYSMVLEGDGYRILERVDAAGNGDEADSSVN